MQKTHEAALSNLGGVRISVGIKNQIWTNAVNY